MPGSAVICGFQSMVSGFQFGIGPKPAKLGVLETFGVDMVKVDDLIDAVFRLDSASPPMMWKDGHLRPAVEAAFATMVMYFDERYWAGEMTSVLVTMCRQLQKVGLALTDPPNEIFKIGAQPSGRSSTPTTYTSLGAPPTPAQGR